MIALCDRFVAGVRGVLAEHGVAVVDRAARRARRAGLRARPAAHRRRERGAARRRARGRAAPLPAQPRRLITPFHNMALMSPATTTADVDRHTEVFAEAVAALV